MAYLRLSNASENSCTAKISSLQYDFNQSHYKGVVITDTYLGKSTNRFDWDDHYKYVSAPSSGSKNYVYLYPTGLNPNTSYTFYAYGYAQNGTLYYAGSDSIRTDSISNTPNTPTQVLCDSKTDTSFKLRWGSVGNATKYKLVYTWYNGSRSSSKYFYSNSGTLSGLIPGTTYKLKVRAYNGSEYSDYTWENPCTTKPEEATLNITNTTENSISIQVSGISGNFDYANVWNEQTNETIKVHSNGGIATFTGLNKNTQYKIYSRTYFTINNVELTSGHVYKYATTLNVIRPNNWSWWYNKVSSQSFNLTADELNAFWSRINEFRTYKGLSSYSFPNANKGDNFTSTMYNASINAINDMSSTGLSTKSSGNEITADYFTTLKNKLNGIS